jgi:biopolymer transport protein TolQ
MSVTNLAMTGSGMSPVALFLQADIVVKAVIVGLLLASIWTWAIIVGHAVRLRRASRGSQAFERDFWKADDIDRFYETRGQTDLPSAKVLAAGIAEWRRSTGGKVVDREGARSRLALVMHSALTEEVDRLAVRLNILATVGSVAPFVGLFGTVWGIMRSFSAIALGLFAAIPAVIAYNRMSFGINRLEARLQRFADGFHATLSRELELEG